VAILNVPGFPNNSRFLTITFDLNVRMTDLEAVVEASSDNFITVEEVVRLSPPFLEGNGPQSLTGFGGLVSNPQILSVEGNVSNVQSVYSARITVRDLQPFTAGNPRMMRIALRSTTGIPPRPTDLGAGLQAEGDGVVITWRGQVQGIDPNTGSSLDGAFHIERSTQPDADYELIGTTTLTDNPNGVGNARFIDTTVQTNRTFFYRVRAVGVAGASLYAINPSSPSQDEFVSVTLVSGN